MKFGLLGEKLGHSYSPQIHSHFGDDEYLLYEKKPSELENFIRNGEWDALNVTIPYKKTVVPFLDEISKAAHTLGSVNTLVRRADGRIYGDNTDVFGFNMMIKNSGIDVFGKKALVFGSGGASATVRYVLDKLGAEVTVISRHGENNYENLPKHCDARILVNTTPLGMFPHNGASPVDITLFPNCEAVFDLIYNPSKTALLLQAEKLGIPNFNGLLMLVAQAKRSREIFTGESIDDSEIMKIVDIMQFDMRNLILVGMPGCGKTTVGKILAEKLGREFTDSDELIENTAEMTIPEIFRTEGESGFRRRETEVLKKLGALSGKIIATGGGCVTRKENRDILRQNGTVVWIKRDIDALPKEGRPLSMKNDMGEMYEYRRPLYSDFSDFSVWNDEPVKCAENIIKEAKK